MNIIKRVVRKLGFDIVRYANPASSQINGTAHSQHNAVNHEPVISGKLAMEALKSVGRKPGMPVFTYYNRPNKSSAAMEEAENLWWNTHGNLIEKVWVLSEQTNRQYRKDYVSKAASFFRQGNKKIKILDLGCGSGWFGRMIADEQLEYYGMDFSSTQIEIANREKEKLPNKEFLNYYCLSDFKKIDNLHQITGVFIHAFLHHLYWDELHSLFRELVQVLPDGCKFFILEPVYPDANDNIAAAGSAHTPLNGLVESYRSYVQVLKNELISKDLYDIKTENELNRIIAESAGNGFFFSPKEVPFRMGEFTSFLKNYLQVEEVFHAGVLDLETAQFIDRIKPKDKQEYYSSLLFPLVESLDTILINNNYFAMNQGTYLFTAFACTLNKRGHENN